MARLNVTISWSKERSLAVAKALKPWLYDVTQGVDYWVSDEDIEGGTRWTDELATQLESSLFGIVCVTPENVASPWVLFEAGALSKLHKSRVAPYLFGLEPSAVAAPLGQFQGLRADRAGTRQLLTSINNQLPPGARLEPQVLDSAFAGKWPELEAALTEIQPVTLTRRPEPEEMIPEILDAVRVILRRVDPPQADPFDPARNNPIDPTQEADRAFFRLALERWQAMDPVERRVELRRIREANTRFSQIMTGVTEPILPMEPETDKAARRRKLAEIRAGLKKK